MLRESNQTKSAELMKLMELVELAEKALLALGKKRQLNKLCYCNTIAGIYCVRQEQCVLAQEALSRIQEAKSQMDICHCGILMRDHTSLTGCNSPEAMRSNE